MQPASPAQAPQVTRADVGGILLEGVAFDSRTARLIVADQPGGPGARWADAAAATAAHGGLAGINAGVFQQDAESFGRDGKAALDWPANFRNPVMSRLLLVPIFVATPLVLGSCGTLKSWQNTTVAAMGKFPKLATPGEPADQVKVVKARPQDLQDLPLGHEQALTYEKQRKLGLWQAGGEANFKPPDLPEPGAEMDGSLLPPKLP